MDPQRFDALVGQLTAALCRRRSVVRFAGTALASLLVFAGAGQQAAAACKQDRKPCTDRNQCCSGVCRGPRGRKKCRAALGQGTCTIEKNTCEIGGMAAACDPELTGACACFRRPNGAAFCADTADFDCLPCAQCPPGTTCVRARNGLCVLCPVGTGATETICVKPCTA
jgi:hypothetical protein